MPPKAKKLSDKEAEKVILDELQKQNRPFNHTLLHATMHGAVTKTQCQNLLDSLAGSGSLICKEFGKAKVYWADQEGLESVPPERLKEIDAEIESIKQEIKDLTQTLGELQGNLASIEASQTTEDVLADISRLEEENEKLEKKEQVLAEAAQSTDPKDLEKLRNQVEATENVWRKRKRQCKDILDTVSEGMDKKPAVVIEELGLTTDEEVGVELPTKKPPLKRQRIR